MKKITFTAFLLFSLLSLAQNVKEKAKEYLKVNHQKFNLSSSDVSEMKLMSVGDSKSGGFEIYYYNQTFNNVEVLNAISGVAFKNGEIFHTTSTFVKDLSSKVKSSSSTARITLANGLEKVLVDAGLKANLDVKIAKTNSNYTTLKVGETDVCSKQAYVSVENDKYELAWIYDLYSPLDNELYSYQVSALDGRILQKENQTIKCTFGDKHVHSNEKKSFQSIDFKSYNPLVAAESSSYRVIPFDIESPIHGSRQLISSPADATASPYGWHNTLDGNTSTSVGYKYTNTRGNNVFAMDDKDGVNSTIGQFAEGGSALSFDFPYNGPSLTPEDHLNASITNLFYMNNMMHDIMYKYGFDERNGNFQRNNYGRGEKTASDQTGDAGQGDYVLAEAQDGASLSNANFSTLADGSFGSRMQMFLWDTGGQSSNFKVNNTVIAGDYLAADNSFTNGHVDYPAAPNYLTSDLVLYDDGTPDNNDACTAAVNNAMLAGKIALIRRGGGCGFIVKVKNAQNAGAIAAVVFDNVDGPLVGMSGDDATITIPAVRITKTLGDQLVAELQNGAVNVSIQDPKVYYIDGDLDNGIIAHEYGHGVSTRLAGGRLTTTCLRNSEQQGEGWSDFFAYMLTMKNTDSPTVGRGIGNFANGTTVNGNGIRKYKYSTDMSVNPFTFSSTNSMIYKNASGVDQIDVHAVGSVWATMLWDLAWAYINKYGFDSDVVNGAGGNNKVMQIVIDGLKLQPCNASFVQARDAIIAADQAKTGGQDFCMIWDVFARRGLGFSASSGTNAVGSNTSTGTTLTNYINGIKDQVDAFDIPAPSSNCSTLVNNDFNYDTNIKVYPNPSNGLIKFTIPSYVGKVTIAVFDLNGRRLMNKSIDFNSSADLDLSNFSKGIYLLKLKGDGIENIQKIVIE